MTVFTASDLEYLAGYGLTITQLQEQANRIIQGVSFIELDRAATLGDGILKLTPKEMTHFIKVYEEQVDSLEIQRFVPASGAATRMFQELYAFLDNPKTYTEGAALFFNEKKKFAFYKKLIRKTRRLYPNYDLLGKTEKNRRLVKSLLGKKGLNYGQLPKALLAFHLYNKRSVTAFEEQLFEAAQMDVNPVKVHFTISEVHQKKIRKHFLKIKSHIKRQTGCDFKVDFSFQPKHTDSIALGIDNQLVRDEKKQPLLRPSGHGALLENLNALDADILFIKNIDNVVVQTRLSEIIQYKKALAGQLIVLRNQIFDYLKKLDQRQLTSQQIQTICTFVKRYFDPNWQSDQVEELHHFLNRPIRVCGMVQNTGQPGGGPFWVRDKNGRVSLQIVELAQVNTQDHSQLEVIAAATHFNPVDLVCSVRDYRGKKFDLNQFIDADSSFIATKSYHGKMLRSEELPGLWNGAMAGWLTVFIEVPPTTFNPVKTVTDLLNDSHQSKFK